MTEATEHARVIKLWCEWLLSFILAHSKFSWAGVSFLIKNNVYLGEYYLLCGWGTGKVWGRVLFTHVIWGKNPCVILLERWNHHWFFLSFTYWYYWYHLSTPGMECQIKNPCPYIYPNEEMKFLLQNKAACPPCVKHRTSHSCFTLASKTMSSHICWLQELVSNSLDHKYILTAKRV